MDDLISEFVAETAEALSELDTQLVALERNPDDAEIIGGIFRIVHTIKGTCGFLGLPRLESIAHAAENVLGRFRDGELAPSAASVTLILSTLDCINDVVAGLEETGAEPPGDDAALIARLDAMAAGDAPAVQPAAEAGAAPADGEEPAGDEIGLGPPPAEEPDEADDASPLATAQAKAELAQSKSRDISASAQNIRVSVHLLEDLMTMVSELVLTRNQLLQTLRQQEDSAFATPLQRLNHITSELQEGLMKTRMQPIGVAWNKLPRIVRDLAQELGKKIELEMIGAETELDRQVLELIKDPLTHMVRNSCDHGLEPTAERRAAGKGDVGRITLHALHEGGHIIIRIADDGRGLPLEKIKAKALANGLATEAELAMLSSHEINQFIFKAGFSTAQTVTSVSGRGVGMDVARANIEKIGGAIELESVQGRGSAFTIKIPQTLDVVAADLAAARSAAETVNESAAKANARSDGEAAALLMFKAGDDTPKAVPLSLVARLEDAPSTTIERADGRQILRRRGKIMPLLGLGRGDAESRPLIVFNDGPRWAGLIVDEIIDIVETPSVFESGVGSPGMLGTIVVDGRSTEVIDAAFYLTQIHPDWLAGATQSGKRKNEILIVDDSPFFRHLLKPLLQQAGYAVTSVESAEHALALKDNGRRFDLIVSEIDMPGMDGFAFAEAVRASSEWAETPLVALSGRAGPERVERGRAAGFAVYVGKTDREGLLHTLSATLADAGASA